MATAQQIASPGVYVTDDIGLEVTDGVSSRVQLGLLPTGGVGLRVVSSDGTTVIIDGSSDMFRIVSSGTMSVTTTAHNANGVSTTLSGLGALAATPAHMGFIGASAASGSVRRGPFFWTGIYTQTLFVAATSGGASTTEIQGVDGLANFYVVLDGSSFAVPTLDVYNYGAASSNTTYVKYYVLAQAAI